MKEEKKTLVVIISKQTKDELEEICRRLGSSINAFVVSAIREKIQKTKKLLKEYERENL
jgi:hypothetical protein